MSIDLEPSVIDFSGVWERGNTAIYFRAMEVDGSVTYTQTFPKTALPDCKARCWSVVVVEASSDSLIPNPLNRHLLSSLSLLEFDADGSLTLIFGPTPPVDKYLSNWLPTHFGRTFNITHRFYVPTEDVSLGDYFPPPLIPDGNEPNGP
jgi:hypothetical protein